MKTQAKVKELGKSTIVVALLPGRLGPQAVMRRTAFELVVFLNNLNRL